MKKFQRFDISLDRGVYRAKVKSKMKLFVTKLNGFQPLSFVKMSSILDFLVLLDTPLFWENQLEHKHLSKGFS